MMTKRLTIAALLSALVSSMLTSCTVGPKYVRPNVKTPAVFRGADATATVDQNSLGDLKWFEIFKDAQLQNLIRTAMVQNYDVRVAVDRELESRANLGVTRSNQFPQISGGAQFTSVTLSEQGQFVFPPQLPPGFFISRTRNFGTLLLNLASFEVDIWGKLRKATEASRANLLASDENRKAVMVTLVSDVATQYFDLLELDSELEIAKRTLSTRQESLRLIKLQQQNGVASTLEVRQAEELVYTAAVTVPNIELEIEQTENHIHLLLGEDPGPVARGKALTDQEQPPMVPPGIPSKLLERRPDIRAAEQNLIAANANIGVARAAYFPDISLTGFLGSEASQLSKFLTGPTTAWNLVPQISQPIFTGGRVKSGVKLAQAQHEEMLTQYEKTIRTGLSEVSDALVQMRKVREIRVQQELLVAAVRDRVRLAYMRYRGGVDTLLNALDADRDLFTNELVLAQYRRNELLALVQFYKALGGGWQQ